ncbi:hypothetical protein [Hydrogenophaga sp. MI9]|uniref:hypothetical protein n=1 Tax=Hydrogenophaga sp. MI9 TaxID=3453719 RepID=UPI003EEA9929
MASPVYRKTTTGKEEISARRAGLSPTTRRVLIMVNGNDSVNTLAAQGVPDIVSHIDTLLALRLIEGVEAAAAPEPRPAVGAPAPVVAPPPPAPPPAPAAPPSEEDRRLLAAQRLAMQRLVQHFGPDTVTVAQSLLAARSIAQYLAALDGIQAKLAIYMGRKQAEREVQELRIAP